MIKTYIIGTGYLSKELGKEISHSEIIQSKNFIKKIGLINKLKRKNKFNYKFILFCKKT